MVDPPKLRALSRLRAHVDLLPVVAALLVGAIVTARAHYFFMKPPIVLSYDEAYINAFATRMIDGRFLPFVDAISHRGPLLYWTSAIAVALGSPYSWMPMRVLALLCALLAVVFAFSAAYAAGYRLAAAVAALALPVASLLMLGSPDDGLAFNGELLLNVFAVAALLTMVLAVKNPESAPSWRLSASSGLLASMGALSKQVGVATLLPLGVWALFVAMDRPDLSRRQSVRFVAAYVVGAVTPVLLTIVPYIATGQLSALYYYTVTYNADVYMAPYRTGALRPESWSDLVWPYALKYSAIVFASLLLVGAAVGRVFASTLDWQGLRGAYARHGFVITVGLVAGLTLVSANSTLRDYGHYYLQIVPWFALLFGIALEQGVPTDSPPPTRALISAFVLGPVLPLLWGGWSFREHRYETEPKLLGDWRDPQKLRICSNVRAESALGDTLFVWGMNPEIYTSCQRKPASRYVFTTFVAGLVPIPFGRAPAPRVPNAFENLLDDLEHSKAKIIIDAPKRMGGKSIRSFPELKAYVDGNYCARGGIDGFTVLVRKSAPDVSCATMDVELSRNVGGR